MEKLIPENIKVIMEQLDSAGFCPYLVGGCVRDCVMGKAPHDYDITVLAKPQKVRELFRRLGYKTYDVGIKFGTVSVLAYSTIVEITPYRTEGSYTDSRHPDNVEFVSDIRLDLSRRDFTINAMAMDKSGNLLDLFGGKEHIEKKIITCVGNPEERFREDALRILRAIRFSSRLGFSIEEGTLTAMHRCREGLLRVSGERIAAELRETLCHKSSYRVLTLCRDVLRQVLPHFTENEKLSGDYGDFAFRLFCCMGEKTKEQALAYSASLKLSNNEKNKLLQLCRLYNIINGNIFGFEKRVKQLLCDFEPLLIIDIFNFFEFDKEQLLGFIENGVYKISQLAVNGTDIIDLGIFPNNKISEVLKAILVAVAGAELENEKEKIIEFVKTMPESAEE